MLTKSFKKLSETPLNVSATIKPYNNDRDQVKNLSLFYCFDMAFLRAANN